VVTFGLSNQTSVVLNANVELDQIVFDAGATTKNSAGVGVLHDWEKLIK
jgi:hypothetical protein